MNDSVEKTAIGIEKMIAGYSDKSPSVFENIENEPIVENPNFTIIITSVLINLIFVVVGIFYCCYRNVIKKRYSKKISPEEGIQTKPEKDSYLARADFVLPPAYSKVIEQPNSNAMFIHS